MWFGCVGSGQGACATFGYLSAYINCNGFYVGSALWFRHREKFPGSSMIGFLRSRFWRYLQEDGLLNRYFYLEFDLTILEERRAQRRQSEQNHGEPSASGLKDPKEEPVEEMTLDLENRWYSFYVRPTRSEV